MIKEFVKIFKDNEKKLEKIFTKKFPDDYDEIVKTVVKLLHCELINEWEKPNYKNIHEIDDGDYQGTKLYIIPQDSYQPSTYWSVFIYYGSCSGCDALEDAFDRDDKTKLKIVMSLALHIVQGLKKLENNG